jgi:hypothetical protein
LVFIEFAFVASLSEPLNPYSLPLSAIAKDLHFQELHLTIHRIDIQLLCDRMSSLGRVIAFQRGGFCGGRSLLD